MFYFNKLNIYFNKLDKLGLKKLFISFTTMEYVVIFLSIYPLNFVSVLTEKNFNTCNKHKVFTIVIIVSNFSIDVFKESKLMYV